MKKGKNRMYLSIVAVVVLLICLPGMAVLAAEQMEIAPGQVYQVSGDTQLREEGRADAAKVVDLSAGSIVIVTAVDAGGWCEVSCGGQKGYIQTADLSLLGDAEALNQEFDNIAGDYENVYEEVLEVQRQGRSNRIWAVFIIVLVVVMFALGIIPEIKKKSGGAGKEGGKDGEEET